MRDRGIGAAVNFNYVLNFMTHLAAKSIRMMEIYNECDQLVKAYHMQSL